MKSITKIRANIKLEVQNNEFNHYNQKLNIRKISKISTLPRTNQKVKSKNTLLTLRMLIMRISL
jgi:hypothetical protein